MRDPSVEALFEATLRKLERETAALRATLEPSSPVYRFCAPTYALLSAKRRPTAADLDPAMAQQCEEWYAVYTARVGLLEALLRRCAKTSTPLEWAQSVRSEARAALREVREQILSPLDASRRAYCGTPPPSLDAPIALDVITETGDGVSIGRPMDTTHEAAAVCRELRELAEMQVLFGELTARQGDGLRAARGAAVGASASASEGRRQLRQAATSGGVATVCAAVLVGAVVGGPIGAVLGAQGAVLVGCAGAGGIAGGAIARAATAAATDAESEDEKNGE